MVKLKIEIKNSEQIHRETMGLEGGLFVPYDDPTPQFWSFLCRLEGWSQILPSTKLFRNGFEQSCSAVGTQKLEGKVQQHDEVGGARQAEDPESPRAYWIGPEQGMNFSKKIEKN